MSSILHTQITWKLHCYWEIWKPKVWLSVVYQVSSWTLTVLQPSEADTTGDRPAGHPKSGDTRPAQTVGHLSGGWFASQQFGWFRRWVFKTINFKLGKTTVCQESQTTFFGLFVFAMFFFFPPVRWRLTDVPRISIPRCRPFSCHAQLILVFDWFRTWQNQLNLDKTFRNNFFSCKTFKVTSFGLLKTA